jgi:IMP dehydrogenase
MTVRGRVIEITRQHRISGLPWCAAGQVVGIVTNRDLRFETRLDESVTSIMTPRERLVTVREGATLDEAKQLMHQHRLERVLVSTTRSSCVAIITVKDILKSAPSIRTRRRTRRQAARRSRRSARAADHRRARRGPVRRPVVDAVIVSTPRKAHSSRRARARALDQARHPQARRCRSAGNIGPATPLPRAGRCGRRRGQGRHRPGSICTTRVVAGVGVPQIPRSPTWPTRWPAADVRPDRRRRRPLLGRRRQGVGRPARRRDAGLDVRRGTEEAPGEVILYQGRSYKSYRRHGVARRDAEGRGRPLRPGLGRPTATSWCPRGIEGRVPYKGSVLQIIHQLCGGVRASMGYCGCRSVDEMRTQPSFVEIHVGRMRESHVHDVQITKEAPNYHVE